MIQMKIKNAREFENHFQQTGSSNHLASLRSLISQVFNSCVSSSEIDKKLISYSDSHSQIKRHYHSLASAMPSVLSDDTTYVFDLPRLNVAILNY